MRGVVPRRTSRDIRSDSMIDVLHAVLSAGETTRNDIARSTGLSAATVVTIVSELIGEGVLAETKVAAGRVGRPTSVFGMNAARGYVVGIDVAETYCSHPDLAIPWPNTSPVLSAADTQGQRLHAAHDFSYAAA